MKQSGRARVFLMEMVPTAVFVLAASATVDSLMYGNGLEVRVRVAKCQKLS